jgi:hypothetical protein
MSLSKATVGFTPKENKLVLVSNRNLAATQGKHPRSEPRTLSFSDYVTQKGAPSWVSAASEQTQGFCFLKLTCAI